MTAPAPQSHSNGCRISPRGPLVARDLRALVKRMDEIGLSDHADVEIRTPIAGDRRAATISSSTTRPRTSNPSSRQQTCPPTRTSKTPPPKEKYSMGRDTTKASDHKSTNALDDVDTGECEVKFSFGSRNIRVERIPEMGDVFAITLKVQVNGDGNKKNAKGELYPRRRSHDHRGLARGQEAAGQEREPRRALPDGSRTGGPEVEDGSVDTGATKTDAEAD
ncbi:hypothetical protein H7H51_02930 [Mycolicibacterium farcinogenes]|nr:hypothetical protein [Mycolicibacterium farcinogenes]